MFYKESTQEPNNSLRVKFDEQQPFKFFIGGLNKSTSEEKFFQYFSQFGDVSHVEIARSPNRKSKGYGYVCFKEEQGKANALRANLHVLDNARLRVEQAFDPDYRQAKHVQLAERRLYLSGIPSTATQEELCELLTQFGYTVSVTNLRRSNPYSNPNSFYCYVTMDRPQAVQRILKESILILRSGETIQAKAFRPKFCDKRVGKCNESISDQDHDLIDDLTTKHPEGWCKEKSISTIASPIISSANQAKVQDPKSNQQTKYRLQSQFLNFNMTTREQIFKDGAERFKSVRFDPRQQYSGLANCKSRLDDPGVRPDPQGPHIDENLRFNVSRHFGRPAPSPLR